MENHMRYGEWCDNFDGLVDQLAEQHGWWHGLYLPLGSSADWFEFVSRQRCRGSPVENEMWINGENHPESYPKADALAFADAVSDTISDPVPDAVPDAVSDAVSDAISDGVSNAARGGLQV